MAQIGDFMDSKKVKEQLEKAYNEKFHFHWISMSHLVMDQLLKSHLYVSIVGKSKLRKMNSDALGWIKGSTFSNLLKVSYIFGILSDELYNNLKKVNEKRNLILHSLIMKNENLENLNLEEHYNLCQNTIELLVKEILEHTRLIMISQDILAKTMKDLEEKGFFKNKGENNERENTN